MAENDGVWRTISGRRVFIRDGEDLESAMQRSGKFKTKVSSEEMESLKNKRKKEMARKIDKINKENDEFEEASKQLKEIYNRTGRGDYFSEAGKKWQELSKQDKNNVRRDLGDGYSIGVGYTGNVQMSSSHPYDDTEYSWAHKKDNGEWVVHNPIKKGYDTKTFSNKEEALDEMKKIDNHIRSGKKVKDYEGITRYI